MHHRRPARPMSPRVPRQTPLASLIASLLGSAALSVAAQQATPPASAADATPQQPEQLIIYGNAIGLRQTRANVKITAADLDYYPPGVSADKVLD